MKNNPGTFQLMKSKAKHIKGYPISGYSVETFEDKVIDNNSFKGKYVILDFWATWCPPCVKKRPALEAMYKKYGDRLEIISVSLDKEITTVQDFRKAKFPMEWNHSIKPDMRNDPLVKEFVPQGLPYGYLIDPKGKIIAFADELSAENLKHTVERILK
jgi:thiol-disulfide isomerase/thioredoxin